MLSKSAFPNYYTNDNSFSYFNLQLNKYGVLKIQETLREGKNIYISILKGYFHNFQYSLYVSIVPFFDCKVADRLLVLTNYLTNLVKFC